MYQTSSTDKGFKTRLNNNIDEFEPIILAEFTNEYSAMNYEALLHQIFEVEDNDKFYNKHAENIGDFETYHRIRTETYYDIPNRVNLSHSDMIDRGVDNKILYKLISGDAITIADKTYCLLKNINRLDRTTMMYYHEVTLYKYNPGNNTYTPITHKLWQWGKILGVKVSAVINGKHFSIDNHYREEKDAKAAVRNGVPVLLFHLNLENNIITQVYKNRTEWGRLLGSDGYKLADRSRISMKDGNGTGYYFSTMEALNHYKIETQPFDMYYIKDRKLYTKMQKINEWRKCCDYFTDVLKGKQKSLTVDGVTYYSTKTHCVEDNLEYTIKKDGRSLRIRKWEGPCIVGPSFSTLIKGQIQSSRGWRVELFNMI
jgi:hypothetical protein